MSKNKQAYKEEVGSPILFFTDLHIDKKKYNNRKINLWYDMSQSLLFLKDESIRYNACAVLFGGDLTDTFDWSSMSKFQLSQLLKEFSPKPFFAAIGNHDVPGGEIDFLPYTAAGVAYSQNGVRTSVNYRDIRKGFLIDFIDNFCIVCCDWGYFDQLSDFIEEQLYKIPKECILVVSCHHNLADRESEHTIYWKTTKMHKRIDFFFCGDIHNGFDPSTHQNKHTIGGNPGAVVRKHIGEADNTPSYFLLYPNKTVKKHSIPGPVKEDLFSFAETDRKLDNDYSFAVEAAKNAKSVDPLDLIKEVAKEIGTPQESIDLFVTRINK